MAYTYIFLALREDVLHFRASKFGLKNTSATTRCLDTMLHKFHRDWGTKISLYYRNLARIFRGAALVSPISLKHSWTRSCKD